jgi:hypothetical protein
LPRGGPVQKTVCEGGLIFYSGQLCISS